MRNEELLRADELDVNAVDRDGWKRVLVTMTGVAVATVVAVLMLSFAANASPSAPPAPPTHTAP